MRSLLFPLLLMVAAPAVAKPAAAPLILAFGDSLTAGYNLDRGLGFAPQLQAALRRRGIAATVTDAGVSGDTSSGGRSRLEWTLEGLPRSPDLVIVELGANDMLRMVDPGVTQENLEAMLAVLGKRKIPVLVAGMKASRNLDPGYRARFDPIYADLARRHGAPLYPFFLEGVVGTPGMQQADGMHPTFEGVKRIVTGILPQVVKALGRP